MYKEMRLKLIKKITVVRHAKNISIFPKLGYWNIFCVPDNKMTKIRFRQSRGITRRFIEYC